MPLNKAPSHYTVPEAAKELQTCEETVRRMCREKRLPHAFRLGGRGTWRIPVTDVLDMLNVDTSVLVPEDPTSTENTAFDPGDLEDLL